MRWLGPIGDVQVARTVRRHNCGEVQLRRHGCAAVPVVAARPVSRYRGDHPRSIHLADAVVGTIGDVQVARAVQRHVGGEVQLRRRGLAAVPAVAGRPVSRHRGDIPRRVHLADAVVVSIGDVQVARAVQRHACGGVQLRRHGCAAVPVVAAHPVSRHRGDIPRGVHLADAVVGPIGDVQVARAVQRHACGVAQLRRHGCAAVPVVAVRPFPATVVIIPAASTLRMRLFSLSTMYRLPAGCVPQATVSSATRIMAE